MPRSYPQRPSSGNDRSISRRRYLAGIGAFGALALTGRPAAARTRAHRWETGPEQVQSRCPLPVFTDPYVGFSVGRPEGWRVQYSSGIVWAWPPGSSEPRLAFAYPGWLAQGTSPETVAAAFLAGVNQGFESGDGLEMDGSGRLRGTDAGVPVAGEIAATVRPEFGQHFALIWGGWVPERDWPALRDTVMAVGGCYQQFPSTPLEVQRTSVRDRNGQAAEWEYVVPPDWRAGVASSQGIDIVANGGHVGFSFIPSIPGQLDGWGVGRVTIDNIQATTPWRLTRVGEARDLGTAVDARGNQWHMIAFEYLADWQGQPYYGVLTAAASPRQSDTAGLAWQRETVPEYWDFYAAITEIIQANVRVVNFSLGHLLSPTVGDTAIGGIIDEVYRANSAVHDAAGRNFSDALMGNDRVIHPQYDVELVLPSNTDDPSACPEGQRPVPDPYDPQGTPTCMPFA